ncbi:hypothetical protein OVX87_32405 [Klebsiella pneumoniae]|nr:hypothetical protein [Klebsiella pneumoniae]
MTLEQYNVSHAKRQARNAENTADPALAAGELCSTAELVARRLGIAAVQPVYRFWTVWWRKGCWSGRNTRLTAVRSACGADAARGGVLVRRGRAADGRYSVSAVKGVGGAAAAPAGRAVPAPLHGGPGATGWRYLHRMALKGMKVPDALAELDGRTVAFEVERTVKSRRRYQEVVSGYLFNRRANGIDEIWYICPDRPTLVRVQRAILAVDEIVNPQTGEARKTVELDRERLFACFKFMTTE